MVNRSSIGLPQFFSLQCHPVNKKNPVFHAALERGCRGAWRCILCLHYEKNEPVELVKCVVGPQAAHLARMGTLVLVGRRGCRNLRAALHVAPTCLFFLLLGAIVKFILAK